MANTWRPDFSTGRIDTGNNIGDILSQIGTSIVDRADKERQQKKLDEQYNTNLEFKKRAEQRDITKLSKAEQDKIAQNKAMHVLLNPKSYTDEERASILGNAPDASGLAELQNTLYNRKLKDPTSDEYKAAQDAEWKRAKKLLDYKAALNKGSGDSLTNRLKLLKLKKDAEDERTAKANYINALGLDSKTDYSLDFLKKEYDKRTGGNKNSKLSDVLSKVNAGNWIYGDRKNAITAAEEAQLKGYSDKQIAEAIKASTDQDQDFDINLFNDYLRLR